MRVNVRNIFIYVGLLIFFGLAVFSLLFGSIFSPVIRYGMPFVVLLCFALSNGGKVKKYIPSYYIPWLFFCMFILVGLLLMKMDNAYETLCIFVCILISFFLVGNTEWIFWAKKIIILFTGLHVFFTYFFWLFPEFYSVMPELYGYVPVGTSNGAAGYRAGIAGHYSSNGIYISILLMLLVVLFFIRDRSQQKKRTEKFLLIGIAVTFGALLLTGKRGVLMWSIGALAITYFIFEHKKLGSMAKIGVFALLGIGFLLVMSESDSDFSYVFNRFTIMGTDFASLERIAMWQLALSKFTQNPILGSGFWSFRNIYANELFGVFQTNRRFQFMDAHNVYLQVLCETGIVGITIYLLAVSLTLSNTIRLIKILRLDNKSEVRFGATFSLCLQIFYLLYSLSGNCLYDNVFYFYGLALALTTSLNYYKKRVIVS